MSDGTKTDESGNVVRDDTAPGDRPVTVSATEARASEPVLASEEALTKDRPAPASNPAPHSHGRTGDRGEPDHNAAAHVPSPAERTEEGVSYAEVADPENPTERMMKRELELGAEMDYGEHRRTYAMFTQATTWGTIIVVALLVAMGFGFFTSAGFLGAIVVFLGGLAGGIFFLKT